MATKAQVTFSADQVVAAAYEGLLGRAPDEEGRRNYTRLLQDGYSLTEALRSFVTSTEFDFGRLAALMPLESLPANPIQFDLSAVQRERLWRHVQDTWTRFGCQEPYYSVVTLPEYQIEHMSPEAVRRFYDSGETDLQRLQRFLGRHGRRLPANGVCLDYGCGLGRVTLWLARHCRKVIAVDVSAAHLDIARRELAARGVDNVEFRLLHRREDLAMLNGVDLFYSVIVLQHNPPPIVVDILGHVFAGLNAGGAAFFQMPTYGFDYGWSYDRFVAQDLPAGKMEMHVVPQGAIFGLAALAGCIPLEVQPDGCAGLPFWMSNTFLFAKPNPAAAFPSLRRRRSKNAAGRLLARLAPTALRPRPTGR